MDFVLDFLSATPLLSIFISLAVGYCVGKIRIGSVTIGATIGTLLVAFGLSRFTTFEIPGMLITVFSVLFCFTLGYEAGPAFFKSLRSQGIKYILQAVFFCVCALGVLTVIGYCGIIDPESLIGIAAGALTQSSILTVADHSPVAYAVTYIFGTVLAILFATLLGPVLLRTDLTTAVRDHLKRNSRLPTVQDRENPRVTQVSVRAYMVRKGSKQIGRTVEEIEEYYDQILQIGKIYRKDREIFVAQQTVIEEADVLVAISAVTQLIHLDDEYLEELSDKKHTELELVAEDIILAEKFEGSMVDYLSKFGIVLHKIEINGKSVAPTDDLCLKKGTVLKVSGIKSAVQKAAEKIGYIRTIGDSADVPFIFGALAVAVIFGAIKILNFSFGESTCALILGLLCGWYCNRNPKVGQYPSGTRWFMKSVGLNLFIAAKGLTTGTFVLDSKLLLMIGIGFVVTLVPHIVTLLFSKYILKMDNADILGGQCGSGTCTAALNAITDSTVSTVFVSSYATTNAIANILLTVVGVVLASLF